jgi:hypothetical protein
MQPSFFAFSATVAADALVWLTITATSKAAADARSTIIFVPIRSFFRRTFAVSPSRRFQ